MLIQKSIGRELRTLARSRLPWLGMLYGEGRKYHAGKRAIFTGWMRTVLTSETPTRRRRLQERGRPVVPRRQNLMNMRVLSILDWMLACGPSFSLYHMLWRIASSPAKWLEALSEAIIEAIIILCWWFLRMEGFCFGPK